MRVEAKRTKPSGLQVEVLLDHMLCDAVSERLKKKKGKIQNES